MKGAGGFWTLIEILGIAGSVLVLATAIRLDPDPRGFGTHTQLGLEPCSVLVRTGTPCLTCGMTTAFANLVRGRVGAAWRANPVGSVLFVLTVLAPVWLLHALVTGRDPLRFTAHRVGRWILPGTAVLLTASWLLRTASW